MRSKQWQAALQFCERAIELVPNHEHAWLRKGVALSQMRRRQEALDCFDHLLSLNPDWGDAWYNKGVLLLNAKDVLEARICFEKAQQLGHHRAAAGIVQCDRQMSQPKEHSDVSKLQDPQAWFKRGVALDQSGRLEEACSCYDRALSLDPENVGAWVNKGRALRALGDVRQAISCYQRVLELDPNHEQAWVNLGVALRSSGRPEEAVRCYDTAIGLDPRNVLAWTNKGNALGELGNLERALACHDEAIRLQPQYVEAWINKGSLLSSSLGRPAEAIPCFEHALRLAPDHAEALVAKGTALGAMGRTEEAIECFDRAIRLEPRHQEAWYWKGHALFELRQHASAVACFDQVLGLNPDYALAWLNKGSALCNLPGQIRTALECFERAQALGSPEAAAAIQSCRERIETESRTGDSVSEAASRPSPVPAQPHEAEPAGGGPDPRLLFSLPPATELLDQALRRVSMKEWDQAGEALTRFARLRQGRFTIWQMMRDMDRLWSIVRRLARSGQQTSTLKTFHLACAVCGRVIVNFGDVDPEDPVLDKKYFPSRRWRCPDPGHLSPSESEEAGPPRMLYPDVVGLEFPTQGDTVLEESKANIQRWHFNVLERRREIRESCRSAGLPIGEAKNRESAAYYHVTEDTKRYAQRERARVREYLANPPVTTVGAAAQPGGGAPPPLPVAPGGSADVARDPSINGTSAPPPPGPQGGTAPLFARRTTGRTVREFTFDGDDFWQTAEEWATSHDYDGTRLRRAKSGEEERAFLKTSGGMAIESSRTVRLVKSGNRVRLEAWIDNSLGTRLLTLFILPEEVGIEPGGIKLFQVRRSMRKAVNDLLTRLNQPPDLLFADVAAPTPRPAMTAEERQYVRNRKEVEELARQYPMGGQVASQRVPAAVCAIFLGALGIHKFLLGYPVAGAIMLAITLFTCGVGLVPMALIGLVEGIIYVTRSDDEFSSTYVTGRKAWF